MPIPLQFDSEMHISRRDCLIVHTCQLTVPGGRCFVLLSPSVPKLHLGDHQSASALSSPTGALTLYLTSEGQVQQQQQNFHMLPAPPHSHSCTRRRQTPNLAYQALSPGAGDMAQTVACLPNKHEDLSSAPQCPPKATLHVNL